MTPAAVLLPLLGAALAGVVFAVAAPIVDALFGRDARTARARRRAARRHAARYLRARRMQATQQRQARLEVLDQQAAAARAELGRHRAAR